MKRYIPPIAILTLLFALAIAKNVSPNEEMTPLNPTTPTIPQRQNILLLGVDKRPSEKVARSDTIILASIDRVNGRVTLLSIPRDTRVKIPGRTFGKINVAFAYGGVDLIKNIIEELLVIKIDNYVITDFRGFAAVVDAMGGIPLTVEKDMHYNEFGEHINLKKGEQVLTGDKALQYVRFRHDKLGDISRTQRQLKFLKAFAHKALSPAIITRLPELIPKLEAMVETDIKPGNALYLLSTVRNFSEDNLITQTLPGKFDETSGYAYWLVDKEEARQAVRDLWEGKTSKIIRE